jgi:uncharacterized membrane protein
VTTTVLRHGLRVLLAALFVFAGVMHLADPAFFHPQVPTWIPGTDIVIRVTGVLFLLGGLGLLGTGRLREVAAVGLMALLLVVWPGNWWGALQPGSYIREGAPNALDWFRVPFQLVFIGLVYWTSRRRHPRVDWNLVATRAGQPARGPRRPDRIGLALIPRRVRRADGRRSRDQAVIRQLSAASVADRLLVRCGAAGWDRRWPEREAIAALPVTGPGTGPSSHSAAPATSHHAARTRRPRLDRTRRNPR